jgi:hypothetical protein
VRIFEEFFKRNNIKKDCLVYYNKESNLILKKEHQTVLFNISWKSNRRRPGKYHFNLYFSPYNGHLSSTFLSSLKETVCDWSNYEKTLLQFIAETKDYNPIFDCDSIKSNFWDFFCFSCNSFVDSEIYSRENLRFSLVRNHPQRIKYINESINYLKNNHKNQFDVLNNNYLKRINNYAFWLKDFFG